MTIRIELTPAEEAILKRAALNEGIDTETFVREAAFERAKKESASNGGEDRLPTISDFSHCATAWDVLEALAGTVEAPSDWSSEHDHYLYGSPKSAIRGLQLRSRLGMHCDFE
jgi:hypothetical protein